MSVKTELSKLGSGSGIIYLTDSDGVFTGNQFQNTPEGRDFAERLMIVSSPVTSNISASATVVITAGGGTITNLAYNSVSVFDTSTPITGATTSDTATNLANAINAYTSSPSYTALVSANVVTVYLDPSQGSLLNGSTGVIAVSGTTTGTTTTIDGGVDTSDLVDSQIGYRIYLNSSPTAVEGSLVGATDITSGVIRKSASTPFTQKSFTISSGAIYPSRDGNVTVISVETEGSIAADVLSTIDPGIFAKGDLLILRGVNAARIVTVQEGGNIQLANNGSFASGSKENVICLQFFNDGTPTWFESFRSPGIVLSVANLRSSGISEPVQGVNTEAISLGGSTTTLTAGTSKGYIALTGTGTLTGSVSYALAPGLVDGDTFIIDYNATITKGSFSITLMGVALTTEQVLKGNIIAKGVWDSSNTNWVVSFTRDTQLVDLTDNTDLALKENSLGNPASTGRILSSTTAGVRSWILDSSNIFFQGSSSTVANTVTTEETLATISIVANTLTSNNSTIFVNSTGNFNANTNAKKIKIYFAGILLSENLYTLTPNGVGFILNIKIQRSSNTVSKCSSSTSISGAVNEIAQQQIGSLDFTNNSYDILIKAIGTAVGDVNLHDVLATKVIA